MSVVWFLIANAWLPVALYQARPRVCVLKQGEPG